MALGKLLQNYIDKNPEAIGIIHTLQKEGWTNDEIRELGEYVSKARPDMTVQAAARGHAASVAKLAKLAAENEATERAKQEAAKVAQEVAEKAAQARAVDTELARRKAEQLKEEREAIEREIAAGVGKPVG